MKKTKIYPFYYILPVLIIFTVFFTVPLIMSLWFSLTNWSFNGSTFVGLRNFVTYCTKSLARRLALLFAFSAAT